MASYRLVVAAVVLSLLALTGCKRVMSDDNRMQSAAQKLDTQALFHEGIKRRFHIRLPKDYRSERTYPLVLVLHGGSGRGDNFDQVMTQGALGKAADEKSVVLVFPDGVRKQWNDGRLEIIKERNRHDDVGFISKVIDKMISSHSIDASKVYATGISNGGFMSFRLAMDLSSKLAAVAPVTAQVSEAIAGRTPEYPISLMLVNGTADPLVPYEGGVVRLFRKGRSRGVVLSTHESINHFVASNQCTGSSVTQKLPDANLTDGTRVEIKSYSNCRDGKVVSLVKIDGGGHTWPGGNQYLRSSSVGPVSLDVNASELILDFLLSHSRE